MKVDAFDFALPARQIAQHPMEPREAARLLHLRHDLRDRRVGDLPELVDDADLLVVNDTKVVPARLLGRRGAARVELLLHEPRGGDRWRAFAKPARKLKAGDTVEVAAGFHAVVLANAGGGEVELELVADDDLEAALEAHGLMPLPPYIRRGEAGDPADRRDYQTIFAQRPGAVAAPTASLHLTDALMAAITARGARLVRLTLHVGAGTFLPVKVADTAAHRMHAERFEVSEATAAALTAQRSRGGRIFACGTTVVRTLETVFDGGTYMPASGRTDLFIRPGVPVRSIDRMLTNFHLPKSTLLMLVAAIAGLGRIKRAYAHAVRAGYRFFSYGDACLIERGAR
jgi:S-adenosylmethionine:tRNA ribosyltransferase-isomerase